MVYCGCRPIQSKLQKFTTKKDSLVLHTICILVAHSEACALCHSCHVMSMFLKNTLDAMHPTDLLACYSEMQGMQDKKTDIYPIKSEMVKLNLSCTDRWGS